MSDTPATTRTHQGPILVEWATLAYTLFTTLLIVLFWSQMGNPLQLLEGRGMVVGGMALLWLFYHLRPNKYILLLRYIFPLSLLGYWYPDTYEFCQLFPNLDYLFAAADHALFGCQPSITFAQWLPQKVWSELFHMGYFAYYPLIFLTVLAPSSPTAASSAARPLWCLPASSSTTSSTCSCPWPAPSTTFMPWART